MKLYLNERPRTFVIVSHNYALIIRHPFPRYKNSESNHKGGTASEKAAQGDSKSGFNKVIVEFVKRDLLNLKGFRDVTPSRIVMNQQLLGFLGLLLIRNNIYLSFITKHVRVAMPTMGENIYKITGVVIFCLNSDEYDYLIDKYEDEVASLQLSIPGQVENLRITSEYPAASVRLMLELGSFYYSRGFDITSNLQERGVRSNKGLKFTITADSPYFKRFWWNSYLNSELLEFRNRLSLQDRVYFDNCGFLTIITRGYARSVNTVINQKDEALLTIISKQSCVKNGPLFGYWGCDDNGSVSNYTETEIIIYSKDICFSYVIVKGNVPIFWHLKTSNKKGFMTTKRSKKIDFPRSFDASNYAFMRHFDIIVNQFGESFVVNLLPGSSKSYKKDLNDEFEKHIKYLNNTKNAASKADEKSTLTYNLRSIDIPLKSSYVKKIGYLGWNPPNLSNTLTDAIIDYGALFFDKKTDNYIGKQLGVLRIVSFDSLKKANFISKIICQEVIQLAFKDTGMKIPRDLLDKHATLWAENHVALKKTIHNYTARTSRLHASSSNSATRGAVKSMFPKKYLSGVVEPKPNEMAMLKLLGRLQDQVDIQLRNPIQDYVSKEIQKKAKDYSYDQDISIFATTFNVNGSIYEHDITRWLFPTINGKISSYDIVFIGFEEITELTAGQMMNPDTSNRIFWEQKINDVLDEKNPEGYKYISMWSGQMGGIALLLYIKSDALQYVRNVEGSFKKTGFGGVSANKGGIAVSFSFSNTEICFVVSHLAAGFGNVDERHQDYKSIAKGIKFSKNRRIRDHDAVIWLGDFNYRISLANSQVKPLIEKHEYNKLFDYDQLNQQMASGESFPFFDEMEITFAPTYKFDHDTQTYDTSEKQRVPAWTDRVLSLSKNKIIKQHSYNSVPEISFSDHRPVFATFTVSVNIVNEKIKKRLSSELYDSYRENVGDINELLISNNLSSIIDTTSQSALPPPSSDIKKWWLEGGKAAKISIPKLAENENTDEQYVMNPYFPNNPFEESDQPEFVKIASLKKAIHANA